MGSIKLKKTFKNLIIILLLVPIVCASISAIMTIAAISLGMSHIFYSVTSTIIICIILIMIYYIFIKLKIFDIK